MKIEHSISDVAGYVGTSTALGAFFTMGWWDEHSKGVVAICATIGCIISALGFLISRASAAKKARREKDLLDHEKERIRLQKETLSALKKESIAREEDRKEREVFKQIFMNRDNDEF